MMHCFYIQNPWKLYGHLSLNLCVQLDLSAGAYKTDVFPAFLLFPVHLCETFNF